MLVPISCDNFLDIRNAGFREYARHFAEIEKQAIHIIESYGLSFQVNQHISEVRTHALKRELAARGVEISNNGHSIHVNWLSGACVACRTGNGSYTTFASLKCHRDCFFCFNQNQENYHYFQDHTRDLRLEASELITSSGELSHVAITGGEPLLHKEATVAFFSEIHKKRPSVHSRLYTAGDHFGRSMAAELQHAGLKEIRFSIKIDDPTERQSRVLNRIAMAKDYIPRVIVEMPVIPGSLKVMLDLFDEFERIGLDGVNLLELCFPLTNAEAFRERGLLLKYPPYQVFYNYWYAGGLAIAGSEEVCLELMLRSLERGHSFGMHYCSLENKHTGQVFQQNQYIPIEPVMYRSSRDFFLKSAKIFGKDEIRSTMKILESKRKAFRIDEGLEFIEFHPKTIDDLEDDSQEVCLSYFIADRNEADRLSLVEVKLNVTTPKTFSFSDI